MTKFHISVNERFPSLLKTNLIFCMLIFISLAYLYFICSYVLFYVVGASMQDTLNGAFSRTRPGGDFIYVRRGSDVSRGDIVVIDIDETSDGSEKIIIKRIIALGGDTVELKGGRLYLNGELTEEPYVSDAHNDPADPNNTFAAVTVPEGTVFCMGDNRNVSLDSRTKYGFIDVDDIVGSAPSWALVFIDQVTAINTFFDFTLPSWFS